MLARGSGVFLLTNDFDYGLPEGLIAMHPARHRDASRLLILSKYDGERNHCFFRELPRFLRSRSLIVLNDTRVIPARLSAHKPTGGHVEVFLVEPAVDASPASPERGRGGEPSQGSHVVVGEAGLSPASPERGRAWEPSQGSHVVAETWVEKWRVLVRGLGRSPIGTRLSFDAPFTAEVCERGERGAAVLCFFGTG